MSVKNSNEEINHLHPVQLNEEITLIIPAHLPAMSVDIPAVDNQETNNPSHLAAQLILAQLRNTTGCFRIHSLYFSNNMFINIVSASQ
jgi:hypothetical protein